MEKRRGRKPSITKKSFMQACEDSFGIIANIARILGVERKTVYNFLERYPEMHEQLDLAKDRVFDRVENKLMMMAVDGNMKAIDRMFRSRKARDRGYGDYQEVSVSGEMTQNIKKLEVEIIETKKDEI